MGLQEKLKEHKTKFEKHAKPEILEVMRRAKSDLRNSGILDRALKVGDKKDILSDRLIVLTFYRGTW
jgi:hypothetical protein